MRWLRELLNPALACERKGHRLIERRRPVYLYPPTGFRAVADRAIETVERCARCGFETEPKIERREGVQGLTLPSQWWDRLKAEGRFAP